MNTGFLTYQLLSIGENMKIKVDEEFRQICKEIIGYERTEEEWSDYDISDMFQTKNYCGGFESLENEFTFSYFGLDREYWFQLALDEIKSICNGEIMEIEMRLPD